MSKKASLDRMLVQHGSGNDLLEVYLRSGELQQDFPEVYAIVGFGDDKTHKDLWKHVKQVVVQCPPSPKLRWVALFHDIGKPQTFKMIKGEVSFHGHETRGANMFRHQIVPRTGLWEREPGEADEIEWLIRNSNRVDCGNNNEWTDSAIRRIDKECGWRLPDLIRFARADVTTGRPERYRRHQAKLDELSRRIKEVQKIDADRNVLPKGLGQVLLEHYGKPPGPWLGAEMNRLRDLVLSGQLERNREIEYYISHLE